MTYSQNNTPNVLASKEVPNGRWGDHTVEVCEQNGEFFYCNGWNSPLLTNKDEAFRLFDENEGRGV